jgi:hypothetical protein
MSDKRIAEIESAVENYIKHERDMMYGYDDELSSQVRFLSQLVTEVKYQRAIVRRVEDEWRGWRTAQRSVIGQDVPEEIVQHLKMLEHILGYTPDER